MPNAKPHAELRLERFLPYRLSVLSNRISQDIARLYSARFNLTITEWRVMAVLGHEGGLSANTVAERTAMDKVAVSRAVSALMAKKILNRQTDPADARRSSLKLSAKGYGVFDQIVPLALAYERRILASLEPAEQSQLLAILDKLEAAELAEKPRVE
ncbi:MAG: MarR family winged helix-turn-helix transcriptional regulator [Arenimonas sp.]|uniref:MarR family winged helix-turn-helix transcriptional regulator n=1 Tax=Arenimonas sp. TaxID=1872635 RepID=UPI003C0CCD96